MNNEVKILEKIQLYDLNEEYNSNKPHPLELVDKKLLKDKKFILKAIKIDSFSLKYADEDLRNDPNVALYSLKIDGGTFDHFGQKLLNNKKFLIRVIKSKYKVDFNLRLINPEFLEDKNFMYLYISKIKPHYLEYSKDILPKYFKHDEKFIKKISKINDNYFDLASKQIREKYLIHRIKKDGYALTKYRKFKNQKKLILLAAKTYGAILRDIDKKFKKDKEVVLACCKNNDWIIGYADKKFYNNRQIVKAAIDSNSITGPYPEAIRKIGRHLKDIFLIKYALKKRGDSFNYLRKEFRKDKSLAMMAIKEDASAYYGLSNNLKNDPEILHQCKQTGFIKRYPKRIKKKFKVHN
tara:strand:- start:80 stop:1135 length:1056 start_codon:yes stop_codon:yes gene_type:complete